MRPNKWERLLDQKPVRLSDHLVAEAAKLFCADLRTWPPAIDEFDPQTGQALAALVAEHPQRPDQRLYAQAFRLTRWDLSRDFDAIDEYWRNLRHLEAGLTMADKPMILFLTRFLTEQLLGLSEATQGRINRPRLLDALGLIERDFLAQPQPN